MKIEKIRRSAIATEQNKIACAKSDKNNQR